MKQSSARRGRAHSSCRSIAGALIAAACGAVLAGPAAAASPQAAAAAAAAADAAWQRALTPSLTRHDLGLPAAASDARLATSAIERREHALTHGAELGDLHFDGRASVDPALHALAFSQRLDGLRVLWSHLDVTLARGGEVSSIGGTVVPLPDRTLRGEVKLTVAEARGIARRAVMNATAVRRPELVAYAGTPDRPRSPRRAYAVEVSRPSGGEEKADAVCLVIDAGSGELLTQWRGRLAPRPQPTSRAARGPGARAHAAAKSTIVQVDDAKGQDVSTTDSRLEFATNGDPYLTGVLDGFTDVYGFPYATATSQTYRWAIDVTRYFCFWRNYCGRDSGQPGPVGGGTYNRVFVTGNWNAADGSAGAGYEWDSERIFVSVPFANTPGALAHEFGHMIDAHFLDDLRGSREGDEIKEALADMFALDYERRQQRSGSSGPTRTRIVENPTAYGYDYFSHYSQYRCTAGLYQNATILSHAFLKLSDLIGFEKSGRILQGVPWALPGHRTFGSVRTAFEVGASAIYGADSYELAMVRQTFSNHGIGPGTTRSQMCGWDGW